MRETTDNIMKNDSIVKIGDLTSDYKFFVPSYQRGYRWTSEEVKNLLNDLYEFYSTSNDSDMYCLQPLMVKGRAENSFEVIDGQQRLTTIFIIMKIINESRNCNPLFSAYEENLFSIEYETRKGSEEYLKSLNLKCELDVSNIDYYYFTNTVKTFTEWLDGKDSKFNAISSMLNERTFFIWYELPANTKKEELFELFKKVNIGKIQLTDAELIKALMINKDNFKQSAEKVQEEIAVSWDRIEQGLREDNFWYFFNEDKGNESTRIDVIFELIARRINAKMEYEILETEDRFIFLVIARYITDAKDKETVVKELWEKVEFVYASLRFWYQVDDLYHIIGYLIAVKQMSIFQIWDSIADKRKKEQLNILMEQVRKSVGHNIEELQLNEYEYGTSKRKDIRKILLLHNIATIVIKEDKEIRFPFEIMKKRNWDIEHIHATADNTGDMDNSLANLALLDAKINREYKNAPYSKKRETILKYDKDGRFIPLCTKFVFYKLYTPEVTKSEGYDNTLWNDWDKEHYLKDMKSSLEAFFGMEWYKNG